MYIPHLTLPSSAARAVWLGREARGSVGGKGEIAFSTIAFSLPLVPGGRRGKMRPRRPRENYVERGFLFHHPFAHQGLFSLMKIATRRPVSAAGYKVAGFSAFQGGFFGCFCAFPCFSFSSSPFLPFGRGCIVSAFSPLPSPLPAARFVSATQVWLLSEKREMADAEKKGENGGSRKLGKNRRRRRRRCVCATRRRPRGRKRKKRKSASEERNRDRAIKSEGGKRKRRKRDFFG